MEVDFDGTTDTISIRTPVNPTQTPSPTPTATPIPPTPTPTAPPTQTPEGKYVESLRQSLVGDTLTATLTLSAPLETYNTMTLNGPNRVVLDLAGFFRHNGSTQATRRAETRSKFARANMTVQRELYLMLQPYRDTMSRFRRINGRSRLL